MNGEDTRKRILLDLVSSLSAKVYDLQQIDINVDNLDVKINDLELSLHQLSFLIEEEKSKRKDEVLAKENAIYSLERRIRGNESYLFQLQSEPRHHTTDTLKSYAISIAVQTDPISYKSPPNISAPFNNLKMAPSSPILSESDQSTVIGSPHHNTSTHPLIFQLISDLKTIVHQNKNELNVKDIKKVGNNQKDNRIHITPSSDIPSSPRAVTPLLSRPITTETNSHHFVTPNNLTNPNQNHQQIGWSAPKNETSSITNVSTQSVGFLSNDHHHANSNNPFSNAHQGFRSIHSADHSHRPHSTSYNAFHKQNHNITGDYAASPFFSVPPSQFHSVNIPTSPSAARPSVLQSMSSWRSLSRKKGQSLSRAVVSKHGSQAVNDFLNNDENGDAHFSDLRDEHKNKKSPLDFFKLKSADIGSLFENIKHPIVQPPLVVNNHIETHFSHLNVLNEYQSFNKQTDKLGLKHKDKNEYLTDSSFLSNNDENQLENQHYNDSPHPNNYQSWQNSEIPPEEINNSFDNSVSKVQNANNNKYDDDTMVQFDNGNHHQSEGLTKKTPQDNRSLKKPIDNESALPDTVYMAARFNSNPFESKNDIKKSKQYSILNESESPTTSISHINGRVLRHSSKNKPSNLPHDPFAPIQDLSFLNHVPSAQTKQYHNENEINLRGALPVFTPGISSILSPSRAAPFNPSENLKVIIIKEDKKSKNSSNRKRHEERNAESIHLSPGRVLGVVRGMNAEDNLFNSNQKVKGDLSSSPNTRNSPIRSVLAHIIENDKSSTGNKAQKTNRTLLANEVDANSHSSGDKINRRRKHKRRKRSKSYSSTVSSSFTSMSDSSITSSSSSSNDFSFSSSEEDTNVRRKSSKSRNRRRNRHDRKDKIRNKKKNDKSKRRRAKRNDNATNIDIKPPAVEEIAIDTVSANINGANNVSSNPSPLNPVRHEYRRKSAHFYEDSNNNNIGNPSLGMPITTSVALPSRASHNADDAFTSFTGGTITNRLSTLLNGTAGVLNDSRQPLGTPNSFTITNNNNPMILNSTLNSALNSDMLDFVTQEQIGLGNSDLKLSEMATSSSKKVPISNTQPLEEEPIANHQATSAAADEFVFDSDEDRMIPVAKPSHPSTPLEDVWTRLLFVDKPAYKEDERGNSIKEVNSESYSSLSSRQNQVSMVISVGNGENSATSKLKNPTLQFNNIRSEDESKYNSVSPNKKHSPSSLNQNVNLKAVPVTITPPTSTKLQPVASHSYHTERNATETTDGVRNLRRNANQHPAELKPSPVFAHPHISSPIDPLFKSSEVKRVPTLNADRQFSETANYLSVQNDLTVNDGNNLRLNTLNVYPNQAEASNSAIMQQSGLLSLKRRQSAPPRDANSESPSGLPPRVHSADVLHSMSNFNSVNNKIVNEFDIHQNFKHNLPTANQSGSPIKSGVGNTIQTNENKHSSASDLNIHEQHLQMLHDAGNLPLNLDNDPVSKAIVHHGNLIDLSGTNQRSRNNNMIREAYDGSTIMNVNHSCPLPGNQNPVLSIEEDARSAITSRSQQLTSMRRGGLNYMAQGGSGGEHHTFHNVSDIDFNNFDYTNSHNPFSSPREELEFLRESVLAQKAQQKLLEQLLENSRGGASTSHNAINAMAHIPNTSNQFSNSTLSNLNVANTSNNHAVTNNGVLIDNSIHNSISGNQNITSTISHINLNNTNNNNHKGGAINFNSENTTQQFVKDNIQLSKNLPFNSGVRNSSVPSYLVSHSASNSSTVANRLADAISSVGQEFENKINNNSNSARLPNDGSSLPSPSFASNIKNSLTVGPQPPPVNNITLTPNNRNLFNSSSPIVHQTSTSQSAPLSPPPHPPHTLVAVPRILADQLAAPPLLLLSTNSVPPTPPHHVHSSSSNILLYNNNNNNQVNNNSKHGVKVDRSQVMSVGMVSPIVSSLQPRNGANLLYNHQNNTSSQVLNNLAKNTSDNHFKSHDNAISTSNNSTKKVMKNLNPIDASSSEYKSENSSKKNEFPTVTLHINSENMKADVEKETKTEAKNEKNNVTFDIHSKILSILLSSDKNDTAQFDNDNKRNDNSDALEINLKENSSNKNVTDVNFGHSKHPSSSNRLSMENRKSVDERKQKQLLVHSSASQSTFKRESSSASVDFFNLTIAPSVQEAVVQGEKYYQPNSAASDNFGVLSIDPGQLSVSPPFPTQFLSQLLSPSVSPQKQWERSSRSAEEDVHFFKLQEDEGDSAVPAEFPSGEIIRKNENRDDDKENTLHQQPLTPLDFHNSGDAEDHLSAENRQGADIGTHLGLNMDNRMFTKVDNDETGNAREEEVFEDDYDDDNARGKHDLVFYVSDPTGYIHPVVQYDDNGNLIKDDFRNGLRELDSRGSTSIKPKTLNILDTFFDSSSSCSSSLEEGIDHNIITQHMNDIIIPASSVLNNRSSSLMHASDHANSINYNNSNKISQKHSGVSVPSPIISRVNLPRSPTSSVVASVRSAGVCRAPQHVDHSLLFDEARKTIPKSIQSLSMVSSSKSDILIDKCNAADNSDAIEFKIKTNNRMEAPSTVLSDVIDSEIINDAKYDLNRSARSALLNDNEANQSLYQEAKQSKRSNQTEDNFNRSFNAMDNKMNEKNHSKNLYNPSSNIKPTSSITSNHTQSVLSRVSLATFDHNFNKTQNNNSGGKNKNFLNVNGSEGGIGSVASSSYSESNNGLRIKFDPKNASSMASSSSNSNLRNSIKIEKI